MPSVIAPYVVVAVVALTYAAARHATVKHACLRGAFQSAAGRNNMPAFRETYSADELQDVAAYIVDVLAGDR